METLEYLMYLIALPVCYWLIVEFIDRCGMR
jgi:hypothetical protein